MTSANDLLREIRRHNSSGLTKDMQSRIDEVLALHSEPVAAGTQQRRERWIQNIDAAIKCGLPKELARNLNNSKKEIENSIRYGGTQRLRDRIAELEAMLGQPAPAPAQDEREEVVVVGYAYDMASGAYSQYPGEDWSALMTVAQHEHIVAALTRPAQTEQQLEQEPFWYAVVSEQAPTINSAIRRLDVAQEFAYSKRERWPDTRVVPLYTALQSERSGLTEALILSIQKVVHDDRVPNEVSQELAEVLILARRAVKQEGGHG